MTTPSYDWIAHHALVRGDKLAMHDLATGRKFTYREMNERNSRLAQALRDEFGITRVMPNSSRRACASRLLRSFISL